MLGRTAIAVLALGIGAALLYQRQTAGPPQFANFEELRPGLFRHVVEVDLVPLVLRASFSPGLCRRFDVTAGFLSSNADIGAGAHISVADQRCRSALLDTG